MQPDASVPFDGGLPFDAGVPFDARITFDGGVPACQWNGTSVHENYALNKLTWCPSNNGPVVIVAANVTGENWLPGCGGNVNEIMTRCGYDSFFAGEVYSERLKFLNGLDPATYGNTSYRVTYDTRDSMAGDTTHNGFLMTISDIPGDLSGNFSQGLHDSLQNCARLNGAPAGTIDIADVRQSRQANPFACALEPGRISYVNLKAIHPACDASVHCSVIIRDYVPGSGKPAK